MPRYLVECDLQGSELDLTELARSHGGRSAEVGAVWLHAYVGDGESALFALYDAPDPETVRAALGRDRILIVRILGVRALDPSAWARARAQGRDAR